LPKLRTDALAAIAAVMSGPFPSTTLNPCLLYLPPPSWQATPRFPGAHYQRGLFHEINTTFSTGKDTPIDILQLTSNEIEARGAAAAAVLVLGRLTDRVRAGVFTPET
jgi:hypothetical protein